WSPFGRFVVASRRDGLAALDLDGHVHWTLSRRDVRFPRWGGGRVDTRIAYLSGSRLRIVAGDGTEDRVVAGLPAAAPVAPAWRPGKGFLLAYADRGGRVLVVDPSGGVRFETATRARPRKLEWSSDGRLLLVVAPRGLHVYDANGRLVAHDAPPSESHDLDASFVAGGREVAILRRRGGESDVVLLGSNRLIFRTSGELAQIVSSPDGRWLLASWPAADQWVFVRIRGVRRLAADGDIARQFGGFPTIAGWCCATS
ncbi:MAG TPA: hypothetical protein VKA21_07835, partial [Candidatus Binatia bacterium]|nr:hypothetical protein [Candidatus Binatia bacterium]